MCACCPCRCCRSAHHGGDEESRLLEGDYFDAQEDPDALTDYEIHQLVDHEINNFSKRMLRLNGQLKETEAETARLEDREERERVEMAKRQLIAKLKGGSSLHPKSSKRNKGSSFHHGVGSNHRRASDTRKARTIDAIDSRLSSLSNRSAAAATSANSAPGPRLSSEQVAQLQQQLRMQADGVGTSFADLDSASESDVEQAAASRESLHALLKTVQDIELPPELEREIYGDLNGAHVPTDPTKPNAPNGLIS